MGKKRVLEESVARGVVTRRQNQQVQDGNSSCESPLQAQI